ncbi:MAG: hypothetical protein E6F99_29650 [Actinobacteria bacterium]|nr:MAG: hypothetical protein E6F99_29650 [Actinomycetota bacterium]
MTITSGGYPTQRVGHPPLATPASIIMTIVLLLLAGCAPAEPGDHATPDHPTVEPPADPGVLVLQVRETPGMPDPTTVAAMPEFSLYGGGHVVVPADRRGALQTARSYQLTASAYRRIYRQAYAAGLDRPRRIDQPPAADAPTLTVTLRTADGTQTTTVTTPDRSDPQRDPITTWRRSLQPGTWPHGDVTAGPVDYQPTRLAATATWTASASTATQPIQAWPLDPLDTGTTVEGGQCHTYTGDRLTQAQDLATTATPGTRWSSGNDIYLVAFRPLLPNETDCASLQR